MDNDRLKLMRFLSCMAFLLFAVVVKSVVFGVAFGLLAMISVIMLMKKN